MKFLSCTGNVVQDMVETQLRQIPKNTQLITLSIGGNDLQFINILQQCVLQPKGFGDCPKAILDVDDILETNLKRILYRAYDLVFAALGEDPRRKVFVQLYPTFFDATTTWCNAETLGIVRGYVRLSQDLCIKMNALGRRTTTKIRQIIEQYVYDHRQVWQENRIFFLDGEDDFYNGHRICEPNIKSVDDPNIWFWTYRGLPFPSSTKGQRRNLPTAGNANETTKEVGPSVVEDCTTDPRYKTNFEFMLECDLPSLKETSSNSSIASAKKVGGNAGSDSSLNVQFWSPTEALLPYYIRLFHPKPAGYDRIAQKTSDAIRYLAWPMEVYSEYGKGQLQCKGGRKADIQGNVVTRERLIETRDKFCSGLVEHRIHTAIYGDVHVWDTSGVLAGCPAFDYNAAGFVDMCKERLTISIDEYE